MSYYTLNIERLSYGMNTHNIISHFKIKSLIIQFKKKCFTEKCIILVNFLCCEKVAFFINKMRLIQCS